MTNASTRVGIDRYKDRFAAHAIMECHYYSSIYVMSYWCQHDDRCRVPNPCVAAGSRRDMMAPERRRKWAAMRPVKMS
jgi:hypothetical protein